MKLATYSCLDSALTSAFVLKSFHFIFIIFRRHLFSKEFNLLSVVCVDFQLSQPYVSTGITHALNSLSFVCLLYSWDRHILNTNPKFVRTFIWLCSFLAK